MKIKFMLMILLSVMLVFGMSRSKPPDDEEIDYGNNRYEDFHDSNKSFAIDIFSETYARAKQDENLFISPFSISMALSMAYNGAEGETGKQIAKTLGYDKYDIDMINSGYRKLMTELERADEKVEIYIANALFGNKTVDFHDDYVQRCQKNYDADNIALDFAKPSSAGAINNWVKSKTEGLIKKIIEKTSADDLLYLINAIYFNGKWTLPFDENATREGDFNLPDGSTKKMPFMRNRDDYNYTENDIFQGIMLPFGDERFGMYIFLPKEDKTIAEIANSISKHKWDEWTNSLRMKKGSIIMPKFQMDFTKTLNDILKEMGMPIAFNAGKANFEGISKVQSYISQVLHKAVLKVDEEGAEAAAVTAIKMEVTSARPPSETFTMRVDRPYMAAISDTETGEILFIGIVNNPEMLED
ncbi:MAG: serpin family protein [Candidatus Zixiibacteriota bacterium]